MFHNILAPIITGVVSALIAAGLGRLAYERYEQHKQHNRTANIRRLMRPDDRDVPAYITIYQSLFPENETASPEDMVRWLEEYQRERKSPKHILDEYYLLAKVSGHGLGIANLQYYRDSQYLFISYMGIDKKSRLAREVAIPGLLSYLRTLVRAELRHCKGIVYETDRPDPSLAQSGQNRRRVARMQLFRSYARQFGLRAYELAVDYVAPILDLHDAAVQYGEEGLSLNFIPLDGQIVDGQLARAEVAAILRFVYLQVYGDSHKDDAAKDAEYRQYLTGLLERTVAALPEQIAAS